MKTKIIVLNNTIDNIFSAALIKMSYCDKYILMESNPNITKQIQKHIQQIKNLDSIILLAQDLNTVTIKEVALLSAAKKITLYYFNNKQTDTDDLISKIKGIRQNTSNMCSLIVNSNIFDNLVTSSGNDYKKQQLHNLFGFINNSIGFLYGFFYNTYSLENQITKAEKTIKSVNFHTCQYVHAPVIKDIMKIGNVILNVKVKRTVDAYNKYAAFGINCGKNYCIVKQDNYENDILYNFAKLDNMDFIVLYSKEREKIKVCLYDISRCYTEIKNSISMQNVSVSDRMYSGYISEECLNNTLLYE